jgi:3-oxoacyl-[acyl-carrier-protein] synthase II
MAATGVAVTGMGVVSANGIGLAEFHAAQLAARSGVEQLARYTCDGDPVRIAGEVVLPPELTLDRRDQVRADRCTQLGAAAAQLAVADAGLYGDAAAGWQADPERTGVSIGSAIGGAAALENNYEAYFTSGPRALRTRAIPMSMANDASAWIAIRYGVTGPCVTVSTACASGADALIAGYQMIVSGEADVVLAGGAEAPVVRSIVSGFAKMGALSMRNDEPAGASRPFSKDRDGFVIAEGAAVLVLESAAHAAARGARTYAHLRGYGRSSDAHHVTMPHPQGLGALRALRRALSHVDAEPGDVGMVNCHGTSTVLNDNAEALAIRDALGTAADHIPVTATKSLIGHSLGAAGAIEAVATVQALHSGLVPPTANVEDLDPEIDLDVVSGAPRRADMALALSNSFAFGGHNVVLAFGKAA